MGFITPSILSATTLISRRSPLSTDLYFRSFPEAILSLNVLVLLIQNISCLISDPLQNSENLLLFLQIPREIIERKSLVTDKGLFGQKFGQKHIMVHLGF